MIAEVAGLDEGKPKPRDDGICGFVLVVIGMGMGLGEGEGEGGLTWVLGSGSAVLRVHGQERSRTAHKDNMMHRFQRLVPLTQVLTSPLLELS